MRKLVKTRLIISLIIILIINCLPFGASAAATFDEESFRFYPLCGNESGVYSSISELRYALELDNSSNAPLQITAIYSIEDKGGSVIWQKEENLTIPARTTFSKGCVPDAENRYGFFTYKATVGGNFGEVTRSHSFSVAPKSKSLNHKVGMAAHFNFGDYTFEEMGKYITDSGFGWIRDTVLWDETETGEGTERFKVRVKDEEHINSLIENGHQILLILGYTNPLYDNGNFPLSDEAVKAFAEYCGYVAEHFEGRINHFEIYNEPDGKKDANGNWITGAQYAKLVNAATAAVEAVNPNAYIMAGSLCNVYDGRQMDFLAEFLDNVEEQRLDAISFHPYSHENNDIYTDERDNESNHPYTYTERIDRLKAVMTEKGVGDMPIWVSEFGVTDTTQDGMECDERTQAISLVRTAVQAMSYDGLYANVFFTIVDRGTDKNYYEHNWGLMRNDRSIKPSYIAMSAMNDILGNVEYVSHDDTAQYMYTSYKFKNTVTGEDVFVFWKNSKNSFNVKLEKVQDVADGGESRVAVDGFLNKTLTLHSFAEGSTKFYDMYGNPVEIADGTTYAVTDEPLYAVCSGKESKCEEVFSVECENDIVKITGENIEEGREVSLAVYKQNAIGNPLSYIDQRTADAGGRIEFEFKRKNEDVYEFYVQSGGSVTNELFGNQDYKIKIRYFVNEDELTNMAQIKSGDMVKAEVELKALSESRDNLKFFGAVYGDALIYADAEDVLWKDDGTAKHTATLPVEDIAKIKRLKFMLWDSKLSPIIDSAAIE